MPMLSGYSRATIKHNLQILCRENDCSDVATHKRMVAIALATARKHWERYGVGEMPSYLKQRRK